MTRLAVFDWNGTLFDDVEASVTGSNAVLALHGKPQLDLETYQGRFTFPILHFYVANGVSTDQALARHDEASRIFLETYEEESRKCALREGAVELLEWLNESGVHCMILTNHLRENVGQALARFHIRHYFQGLSCNEIYDAAFISRMNKYERLKAYMEEHSFRAEDAVIIGDSFEEPEIAGRLGLKSVNITGGYISEARLKTAGSDLIVDDLKSFADYVAEIWGIAPLPPS